MLFRVTRSFLAKESQLFQGMFSITQPPAEEDGNEERPVPVHNVSAQTFANILTMLYTVYVHTKRSRPLTEAHRLGMDMNFDTEELVDILRAAHLLQFTNVWTVVSKALPPLLGSERRLHLGISGCGVDAWAFPAFTELVYDYEATPSNSEAPLVGIAIWHSICAVRTKIMHARMRVADEIATTQSSVYIPVKNCGVHVYELWRIMAAPSNTKETREALAILEPSMRSCGNCGKQLYLNPPNRLAVAESSVLALEPGWLKSSWESLQLPLVSV